MTQELGPNQRKWLAALRSGEYQQGTGSLCNKGRYCCLGVACELFSTEERMVDGTYVEWDGTSATAPPSVVAELGLMDDRGVRSGGGLCLTAVNDEGKTFAEIAALIESNPANWFTAPK